ncbi:hypothetical protein [Neobacillus terrae]|uniref:hypothetical protein n=1 Tax=Neobacillus terrae TaxID=3034837 RepID=UPI001408257B|nr:hypothetical protein [Neobacillus terrae]NHM31205.1 hypothetical protein [Neobacillus terrae]
MRKLLWGPILLFFLLSGCNPFQPLLNNYAIIDWVDFIKWDGKEYVGIFNGTLSDKVYLGNKIGQVRFKVADNISDPYYRTKDGDAAFLKKGTEIYSIKGKPNLIAVKSPWDINGYRIYCDSEKEEIWQFSNLPFEKVQRVEIYQSNIKNRNQQINKLTLSKDIKTFIELLNEGVPHPNYTPHTQSSDPTSFQVIFYTGEPIAYNFNLQFDGKSYYWFPNDTAVLPKEIEKYFP